MKRRLLALLVVALFLPGCSALMPHTAEVLAPRGFDALFVAIAADVEQLIELIGTYGWTGLFLL